MPSVYADPSLLQTPNLLASFNAGVDRGNQTTFNRLAGQYVSDPSNNSALLGQAAQINPGAALGIQNAVQTQQANQLQQQQQQQMMQLQKIGGAARYYKQAYASGDQNAIAAAKANVIPFLGSLAAAQGKPAPNPQDFDSPEAMAALDQAIAATAYLFPNDLAPQKPIAIGPDQTLIDPRTHQVIYQGGGDGGTALPGMTFNGMPVFRDKQGNLKDVRGNPIPQSSQTQTAASQGLPAETQAYVPKVMGLLGGQPAFDSFGQPTKGLLDAVMQVESGGNPNAVSPAGAQGAYQFMPSTAQGLGLTNPFDPVESRAAAGKYFAQLYQQFGGNAQQAIAAYNAGPGRVSQATQGAAQDGGLQYIGKSGQFRVATPQEIAQSGLPQGTVAQIGPNGQLHVIQKADGFQGASSVPPIGDITKQGADYISSLSPADQDIVKSYITGRQKIPTGTALKNPNIMALVQAAYHADPSLEAGTFDSRLKTRLAFTSATGANSPASQIRTLNTASGHLNQLLGDILSLDNGGSNAVNSVENYVGSKFGGTNYTNMQADLTPVVSEVASLYKGGQATDAEIKHMMDSFPVNGSKSQQISVIERWIGLLHSKLGAMDSQYSQGMGSMADPLATVNPEARAALSNITKTYQTLGLPMPSTIGNAATSIGSTGAPAAQQQWQADLAKYGYGALSQPAAAPNTGAATGSW